MLDIIEDYCNLVGHSYMRLDGSTCLARRKYEIQLFNSGNGGQFIYLLSTRAGALGITLTGADTVIMYDSDWNPTWDKQAHGRVHRIGQTKPVTVYQLLCQETVEELMFHRAQQKISLNEMVLRDHTEAPEDDDSAKPLSGKEIRDMLQCGARRILASSVDDEVELTDAVIEGIISAAASLDDMESKEMPVDENDGDLFEKEMWDIRKFQGEVFSSSKESFKSIADAWAEELLKKPKKREVIATTVEIGNFHVKKINRLAVDCAVSVPKKVKREVVHDNLCLFCAKSSRKVLVKCTVAGCHRAFHQVLAGRLVFILAPLSGTYLPHQH
jgi:SWI/SNF-related matrix-associated actin-dependent regulator of chromatin subfamily A member 5